MTVKTRKKLIEVALPLDAINKASAREKSIRHGHPSTLHLWWARRPLATARAVIFAQMVDDPGEWPDLFPTAKKQEAERQRLFRIIEDLVQWENTTNETVLQAARDEIWRSWRRTCAENADHPRAAELFDRDKLPAFHDPFAGGGSIPLEAQRLGLEAYASDLNPVAVLINRAMIEIPPRFAGRPPVNPEARAKTALIAKEWKGAAGLAEDVRYYGKWMRDEAEKRIGHLYPKVEITAEMVAERPDLKPYLGQELTVIAWLWARTVKSPNPAFAHVDVPLASTFMLSTKPGKEAYVDPVIEGDNYRLKVKVGKPTDAEQTSRGTKSRGSHSAFLCMMSGVPMSFEYLRSAGMNHQLGSRLMAIVAEGSRGRVYLSPTTSDEHIARTADPVWKPDVEISHWPGRTNVVEYGMKQFGDLFTDRQLVALTTFSDLVQEARARAIADAVAAGLTDDGKGIEDGGIGATAYVDSVALLLAFAIDRAANTICTIARWTADRQQTVTAFSRQAIPMTWDYPEVNPFAGAAGDYSVSVQGVISGIPVVPGKQGVALQDDAAIQELSRWKVVSTDPPYYDNVGYADLSDFFYVWLRRPLKSIFPSVFETLAVPKEKELVATPYRHGGKQKAESFFLGGMTQAMHNLATQSHPAYPVTIYYAFKQSESGDADGTTNTGWDTFLAAVIEAGFGITGTWPARTELSNRMIGSGSNALASSIVLVCRPRAADAPTASRREFVSALRYELPAALAHLQRSNIAPVDLAQAAIGPGMAVFTRYAQVLDAEGKPLSVRAALALINQTLDEVLAEQEGDFDSDTRWAITWFEQTGFAEGEYGQGEQLSKSKNTSVAGMVEAGILESRRGKVRLFKPDELRSDWDPATDPRLSAWEIVHQLIRVLEKDGEAAAAALVAKLGVKAESARELAYRLYTICERKKRAAEALSYNGLVQSWPEITRLAGEARASTPSQGNLFGDTQE